MLTAFSLCALICKDDNVELKFELVEYLWKAKK